MIKGLLINFLSVTGIRIFSRILEFILRVYLIRNTLSPQILTEMVALDLIITTSLHITKSCFKPSYQQVDLSNKNHNIVSGSNLMTVGIGVTISSGIFACALQWNRTQNQPFLTQAMVLYALAGVIESIRQKFAVKLVMSYQYKKIGLIQLVSYLPKTLFLFVAVKLNFFESYGILIFAIGQVIFYGISLILTFFQTDSLSVAIIHKIQEEDVYFDPKTKKTLKERIYISFIKLLLQQFQKIILVFKQIAEVSSIYSLIQNFGSIAVRFIFAPLEEIAFNYFSRGNQAESKKTLLTLISNLMIFSTICFTYGFAYAENVLFIVYGEKWTNTNSILALRYYLLLLSVMGINGIMEAFVMARADPNTTIPKFKYYSILSTSIYLISSYCLFDYGLGASGLFLGNTIGMTVRIIISWNLEVHRHLSLGEFVRGVLPPKYYFILSLLFMASLQQIRSLITLNKYVDLAIGIAFFAINTIPLLFTYKTEIRDFLKNFKEKND